MMWRDVVDLVSVTVSTNAIGDPVETETFREVYANKKSIRQSEHYQALATGLRPDLMFEVRAIEYTDEPRLRFNSKTYDIIRSFTKNDEIIELVCQWLV
jgi:SPP1 family predicted phage head-tail adaptor